MKITVTQVSQTLNSLMSPGQKTLAREIRGTHLGFNVQILNQHASVDVYAERKATAVVGESAELLSGIGQFSASIQTLNDVSLIANGSNNDTIILSFGK